MSATIETTNEVVPETPTECQAQAQDQADACLGKREPLEEGRGSKKTSERKIDEESKSTHKQGQSQEHGQEHHQKRDVIVPEESQAIEVPAIQVANGDTVAPTEIVAEAINVESQPEVAQTSEQVVAEGGQGEAVQTTTATEVQAEPQVEPQAEPQAELQVEAQATEQVAPVEATPEQTPAAPVEAEATPAQTEGQPASS